MSLEVWFTLWAGLGQLGIGAGAVFWSHWWRRQPTPFGVPGCVAHFGHLIYFALGWYGFGSGITFIVGAVRGAGPGSLDVPTVIVCLGVGALVTLIAMAIRLPRCRT